MVQHYNTGLPVAVAQLVESQIVILVVVGSSPISHPINTMTIVIHVVAMGIFLRLGELLADMPPHPARVPRKVWGCMLSIPECATARGVPDARNGSNANFARDLLAQYNATVLLGSYLAREAGGHTRGARMRGLTAKRIAHLIQPRFNLETAVDRSQPSGEPRGY